MYFQSLQKSLFQPSSSVTIAQSAESQGEKANSSSDRKLPTPPPIRKIRKAVRVFFFLLFIVQISRVLWLNTKALEAGHALSY